MIATAGVVVALVASSSFHSTRSRPDVVSLPDTVVVKLDLRQPAGTAGVVVVGLVRSTRIASSARA